MMSDTHSFMRANDWFMRCYAVRQKKSEHVHVVPFIVSIKISSQNYHLSRKNHQTQRYKKEDIILALFIESVRYELDCNQLTIKYESPTDLNQLIHRCIFFIIILTEES